MRTEKVCAIILNWNGADQTIACLKSIAENYSIPVIVVDNCSELADFNMLVEAVASGDSTDVLITSELEIKIHEQQYYRCVIRNNDNHGYAGGNNIGIDYAYRAGYDFFWILNNDIMVESGSLEALLNTMSADIDCGFSASVLVYSDNPGVVQCIGGGKLYPWLGKAKLIGKNLKRVELDKMLPILPEPDYLMGASLLVKKDIVRKVGLMDERYFMYSEEADWQRRSIDYGFNFRVSNHSFAQHGDSASTKNKSHMFHFYRNRAAIMYNKKFHSAPCYVFSAIALAAITVIQNLGSLKNIRYGVMGIVAGLNFSWR
jgi:GT2 family glycosyltransferase